MEYPEVVGLQQAISESRVTQVHGVECKSTIQLPFPVLPNIDKKTLVRDEYVNMVKNHPSSSKGGIQRWRLQ